LPAYLDNQPIYLVNCITELIVRILADKLPRVFLWDVKLVADDPIADRRASGSKSDDTSLKQLDPVQD
jgi:hypothetical protein